jgi:hypothetical protein
MAKSKVQTTEEIINEIDNTQPMVAPEDMVNKIDAGTLEKANRKLYEAYGIPMMGIEHKERVEVEESKEHFLNGKVPAGFKSTYGEEITEVTEGQVAELLEVIYSVFNREDGFRVFLKYIDNNRLTILLPLKFAQNDPQYDQLYIQVMKCDCRSMVMRPGNVKQQVEMFAKRLAKRIGYQRGR